MTAPPTIGQLTARLADTLTGLSGLRADIPTLRRPGRAPARLAVSVGTTAITVRVVATAVPLTDSLDRAVTALADTTAGTAWAGLPIRLVVTDLDPAALTD